MGTILGYDLHTLIGIVCGGECHLIEHRCVECQGKSRNLLGSNVGHDYGMLLFLSSV